ncbi:hypothetical protein ACB094_05G019000 [Castanea mollissima]
MITLELLSLLSSIISEAAPTYQSHYCSDATFTPNSTYQANLNLLLSSLSSNSSIESGFYNITVGQNSSNNKIYGLFLCRGNVTTEVCQDCVATATKNTVQQYSPRRREVVIWYDECMLRYSKPNFIIMDDPSFSEWDNTTVAEVDRFNKLLATIFYELVARAQKTMFSSSLTLYSLVQCTPDISSFDCNKCLQGAIANLPNCCSGKQGAMGLYTSCSVRYDVHPSYRIIPSPPLLPPPPAPPAAKEITAEECLIFDLATLKAATNNFSDENKLGKGGFGGIRLGTFLGGQEIAVKRLPSSSKQCVEEFKNEVSLLAKLQHRNLVRLLGFCLEGKEKILVYEYVPNKSLDYFLFDPNQQRLSNWSSQYKIIASNILLDEEMNPKVSNFGMARIFGIDQTQDNTRKIVGTYGYMLLEYAIRGLYSMKSDVYSFGVLILEILSGKKNSSFSTPGTTENLLSYAWKHWRDGTFLELLDSTLRDSYSRDEVKRCIHIGLECIQESPAERPTMATIVLMPNSHSVSLPSPQRPAFFLHNRQKLFMPIKELGSDQSTSNGIPSSVNESSITEVYPR